MKDTIVAARYARALFIVTEKRRETSRALEDLKGLTQVLKPGGRIASYLAAPHARLPDKRAALKSAFEGRVLPTVSIFVDLLLRKKRLGDFATTVDEFESLVEKALGVQRAQVVSAVPLEAEETRRLHESLERYTRSHIKLTAGVDPRLLGGAWVRIGDHVLDRSVKSLLEAIEKQLFEVSV